MKKFIELSIKKLLENLLSIKVWIIFTYIFCSFYLVINDKMTGNIFATSTGSIISIVLAIREGIKVKKLSILSNSTDNQLKEIKKVAL